MMLLMVFIALSPSSILYAKAADDAEHVLKSEVLEVIVTENITFSSNGYADFEWLISVPDSSLADLYREAFDATNYRRLDEEVPIPEYRLIECHARWFILSRKALFQLEANF